MENCCICASYIKQVNENSLSKRIHGCTCDECQQVYESLCNSNMQDIYAFRLAKRYFEKHFSSVENDIHLNLLQLLNEEKLRMQSQIDQRYKSEENPSKNVDVVNQLGIVSVCVSLLADEKMTGSDLYENLHELAQKKFSSKLMIQKIDHVSDLNISSPLLINGYWCMNMSAIAHQSNKN